MPRVNAKCKSGSQKRKLTQVQKDNDSANFGLLHKYLKPSMPAQECSEQNHSKAQLEDDAAVPPMILPDEKRPVIVDRESSPVHCAGESSVTTAQSRCSDSEGCRPVVVVHTECHGQPADNCDIIENAVPTRDESSLSSSNTTQQPNCSSRPTHEGLVRITFSDDVVQIQSQDSSTTQSRPRFQSVADQSCNTVHANTEKVVGKFDDIGVWPPRLSTSDKNEIVGRGPVQDDLRCLVFPITKDRKFSVTHFQRKLKNHKLQKRSWLVYSKAADAVYCFFCKLFSSGKSSLVHDGCRDWKNLSKILCGHETSGEHFEALHLYSINRAALKNPTDLQKNIQSRHSELVEYWRSILQPELAIIQYLARNHCALRGTAGHERLGDSQQGQFLGLVELLAKFDRVLLEHTNKVKNQQISDHYLGKNIQNELISLVGKHILDQISCSVRRSTYFSVILDCTPDCSHEEQMTLVVRYVDTEGDVSVKEHFTGFLNVKETTSLGLTKALLDRLQELGLDIANCRGQGYDNGANMAGRHAGVQKKILDLNQHAFFMPCGSHSLNLVLCDAAKCCTKFYVYFGFLQKLYAAFSSSTKRWNILKENCSKVVKYPSETRWESKIACVEVVRFHLDGVIKSLLMVLNSPQVVGDGKSAAGILKEVCSYEFILSSVIWYNVLFQVHVVSQHLQKQSIQVDIMQNKISGLIDWIRRFRVDGFQQSLDEADQLVGGILVGGVEVQTSIQQPRQRNRTGFFDETVVNEEVLSAQKKYEVGIFNVMVDTFILSMEERFSQLGIFYSNFSLLLNIMTLEPNDISHQVLAEACDKIENFLGEDIDAGVLLGEIESFISIPNKGPGGTALDALRYLVKAGMVTDYHYLSEALRIVLTIPVSVASGERSFSKLKLIKTYLRSRMSQERLNGLALMCIESEINDSLDHNLLIDEFAKQKSRKCSFL